MWLEDISHKLTASGAITTDISAGVYQAIGTIFAGRTRVRCSCWWRSRIYCYLVATSGKADLEQTADQQFPYIPGSMEFYVKMDILHT